MKRYVLTLIEETTGLRRLAFAQQGRRTYATEAEAKEALAVFSGPDGLPRVHSPEEVQSLRIDLVDCYGNGDPLFYYIEENEKD